MELLLEIETYEIYEIEDLSTHLSWINNVQFGISAY